MGLKTFSEQFREDLLRINLQTPPDVVVGLTDLGGSLSYSAYKDSRGTDATIHSSPVADAGNVLDIAADIRKFLFKRNLQTPSDIEAAIIDLSANQSETMRNMGSIGTDANINWRSVVVDAGTIDNAAMVTREANLSRNKPRDLTDPSESNNEVLGESYNYTSLLQTLGSPAQINNFIVPNVQSISSTTNKVNQAARALDLKINRYIPDEYQPSVIRENILNEVYKRTTYVDEYTNSLKSKTPIDYSYFSFYNLNNKASMDDLLSKSTTILENDTALMNIGAYMLNYNLQARFEQNLYSETIGRLNLVNKNYNSDFPVSVDPLELIKIAKDPLNNLVEKNYTITTPRNFVGKAAQFLLGLEGVISPFDLWESVDLGGKDLTPSFLASNEGLDAMKELDPTGSNSPQNSKDGTAKSTIKNTKDDDALLKKTGGGQRWSLYENLLMNKYSPKFDTSAELIGFQKKPKGNYYLGAEERPPIDILQARDGISIINNNALASAFNKGYDDYDGYEKNTVDLIWANNGSDAEGIERSDYGDFTSRDEEFSTGFNFRPDSLMDITQKLLYVGGIDSPIRNLKTKFHDGKMVYSRGNAVKRIQVIPPAAGGTRNKYVIEDPWDNGFCRTWTKLKPYAKVNHLVRYGELIRRERNSVLDQNANYNIYPTKLNVGTLYDQNMLGQDGIRDRFADKNFDKNRARKYMFSIENLAWKDSDKYNDLPAYEQGSNGGRVMWFLPYGLTFNESSTASWTKHDFLGRPEPIYTYNNTERSGTLSWMVIVDHPTILNVMVQKELADMSDAQVDDVLAAFFAGCVEYDIFELARIWGMFSNSDISYFKDVINGLYPYPVNITNDKKTDYNRKVGEATKTTTTNQNTEQLKKAINNLSFFFPNDMPYESEATVKDYDVIYDEYVNWLTTNTGVQKGKYNYDYYNTIGYLNADGKRYFVTPSAGNGNSKTSFDIRVNWDNNKKSVDAIKNCINADKNAIITIGFEAFASSLAKAEHNKALAKRRALSVAQWYAKQLSLPTIEKVADTATNFEIQLKRADGSTPVIFKADFTNGLGEKTVTKMFEEVGFVFGTTPIIYNTGSTTTFATKTDYTEPDFYSETKPYYSVLSYPASYARRVTLNVEVGKAEEEKKPIPDGVEYKDTTTERSNVVNKRDIATRILNKLIGENEYFEFLKENSPVVFDTLKEKLKYFSPAFHSMTPEGLNGRLTFLQQCLRPGDTIKTLGTNSYDIVNTAFGKPPVCVLRIGDFFNTRMIIESLTIDYNVVGSSVTYDLNPEGIGVQPMIAKINLTVKYVGGAGLREPVAQLQNALSYNYYANADIYESRSFGQTDIDERYLENLELAYNSDVLDIAGINLDALENISPENLINFTQLGKISEPAKYAALSLGEPTYNPAHKIKEGLDIVQYFEVDYSELFKKLYDSYTKYISNHYYYLRNFLRQTPNDFFALNYGSFSWVPSTDSSHLDFGYKKDGSQFDHLDYAVFTGSTSLPTGNLVKDKNYFSIGYNSFNRSNASALKTKLHLYPQVDDRIVNPVDYGIQDFTGAMVPKYVDLDYVNRSLQVYYQQYEKYLQCEEWILFDMLIDRKKELNALPFTAINNFREYMQESFAKYYNSMLQDNFTGFGNTRSNFVDFYKNVLSTNTVCNGVDGGITSNNSAIRYLEVVPNVNSETAPNLTEFFNFSVDDCLNKYPENNLAYSPITYQAANALPDDQNRGWFNYLHDQVDNTANPNWFNNGKLYYDFTSGTWKLNGAAVTNISCKTVFEKLNFERLYFGYICQKMLLYDEISQELKLFSKSLKNKSITSYSDADRSRINTVGIKIVNTGSTYSYAYNSMYYGGTNTDIIAAVSQINSWNIKLEDIIFYGFVKYILMPEQINNLRLSMLDTTFTATEITSVNKFVDHFAIAQLGTIDSHMNKIISVLQGFAVSAYNHADTIKTYKFVQNKGSYKLKMFETSESRVNAFGRSAMNEYLQFTNANQ
jgi:hypothetical protein